MRFSVLCFQGILEEVRECLGQSQALETPLQRSQPNLQSFGGYHSGGALLLLDGCVAQAGREGGRAVEPRRAHHSEALFVLAMRLPSHFQVG